MIIDEFAGYAANLDSPYASAVLVTPDDDNDLPSVSRALHIPLGNAGFGYPVRVTMQSGQVVDLKLECGKFHRLRVTRIHQTGTHPMTDGTHAPLPIVVLW